MFEPKQSVSVSCAGPQFPKRSRHKLSDPDRSMALLFPTPLLSFFIYKNPTAIELYTVRLFILYAYVCTVFSSMAPKTFLHFKRFVAEW